ncbi:S1 RNA-binding domain-containing protein [Streptomyces sp. NPDC048650]|uniref:S1 RNA-binding domain-containing protein n=1 Tax=unclassified Streptomyces TaxID=2593676 RepID=UPI0037227B82
MPFGVFGRVARGVEGLIPRAERSGADGGSAEDALEVGEGVHVTLLDVDLGRRRIGLSLMKPPQC